MILSNWNNVFMNTYFNQIDLTRQTAIVHHTAHPHLAADGVFNLATVPKINGLHYCVVRFPLVDSGKFQRLVFILLFV